MRPTSIALVTAALICLPTAAAPTPQDAPPPPANVTIVPPAQSGPHRLSRIAVVGASSSNGLLCSRSLKGSDGKQRVKQINLSDAFKTAVKTPDAEVIHFASSFFYSSPDQQGESQAFVARKAEPTLVVALDFLFWFAYGDVSTTDGTPEALFEARRKRLNRGMALLEELDVPVLVGDLPYMGAAVGTGMLSAEMMPLLPNLIALNKHIKTWADNDPDITMVPLSIFIDDLMSNRQVSIGPNRWGPGAKTQLLQKDQLHPRVHGLAALCLMALETAAEDREDITVEDFNRRLPSLIAGFDRIVLEQEPQGEGRMPIGGR